MSGKIRGVIHFLGKTETFGDKGFKKRTMVLEQEKGSFTNYIPIEFTRDACDGADELQEGDEVEVNYQLGGRKWQKDEASPVRYFLSAEVTGFMIVSGAEKQAKSENRVLYDDSDDGTPF